MTNTFENKRFKIFYHQTKKKDGTNIFLLVCWFKYENKRFKIWKCVKLEEINFAWAFCPLRAFCSYRHFVSLDILSLWAFCLSRHNVFWAFYPVGHFVVLGQNVFWVFSPWAFCHTWAFCHFGHFIIQSEFLIYST